MLTMFSGNNDYITVAPLGGIYCPALDVGQYICLWGANYNQCCPHPKSIFVWYCQGTKMSSSSLYFTYINNVKCCKKRDSIIWRTLQHFWCSQMAWKKYFFSNFRISQSRILVKPQSFYLGIMHLKNKELKSAPNLQYQVSRHLGCKQWINKFRQNCRCDLSDDWIDKNLPSLDDRKLQT